jgi:acyl-CoA reductase-like NAD-dependent aldehyde dehydrogenase
MKHEIDVTAPYDGTVLGSVPLSGAPEVEAALQTAHGLYRQRTSWLPAWKRAEILRRAADLVGERAEQLALSAAREGGKPLIDSRVEVTRAIDGLRNCAELCRTEGGSVVPMNVTPSSSGRIAFTQREPIGVVVAVSAFNHPLNLIVHQVGPAIAAGCPVIVKPSKDTPLSCASLVNILVEAGLPPEWCQMLVTDSHDTLNALVSDERNAFLSFIGSAQVGWQFRSRLAPGTRCALEHGGVAPVIVASDADLELAAKSIAKGGFYHAGQVCVSVQRVYVHRTVLQKFTQLLVAQAQQLIVGDPADARTEVGPLIRKQEVERVAAWVEEACVEGATLVCGGKPGDGQTYQPTVLLEPAENSRVSRHEIFGPVVCLYGYDKVDEAIERANSLPFSFQAAVFTADIGQALHAYQQIACSALMVNDHTAFRTDWMPFAGLNRSGLGVGGIPHTYREMTIEKMLVLKV